MSICSLSNYPVAADDKCGFAEICQSSYDEKVRENQSLASGSSNYS